MNSLSLRSKMLTLVLLPLAVILFLGTNLWLGAWRDYNHADADLVHVDIVQSLFLSVHQLQTERGRSVLFVNGGSQDDLNKQRSNTDQAVANTNQLMALDAENGPSEVQQKWLQITDKLKSNRSEVDAKTSGAEIAKKYSAMMQEIIVLETLVSNDSKVSDRLNGAIMLEIAKESVGGLRALVSNLIKLDQPLLPQQVTTIDSFLANVKANMTSPLLKMTPGGRAEFSKFTETPDWNSFLAACAAVRDKASEGKFGLDSKVFFDQATSAMESLLAIFKTEFQSTIAAVSEQKEMLRGQLIVYSFAIFLCVGIVSFLGLYIFRNVNSNIKSSVGGLTNTSGQIALAFEQLKQASISISSGTSESAASLEETVASIEEISSIVASNADNSKKAAELSKNSFTLAQAGEVKIRGLIDSMKELSSFSKQIENIVGVIDDIAFQINLLALNAAVEAARAGEQGKGFAVVAEAVRDLAQKSASAAKEIGGLIKVSVDKTQNGAASADSSGVALIDILKSVKDVTSIIEEIALSSQEQSKGLGQISEAMNQLDKSTQSNAASAEETSASAEALSTEADNLKQLIVSLNTVVEGERQRRAA